MSRRGTGTRVFVGGLSYRVRERDLEKFFQKIGRVTDISMKNGFAFVEFDDYRDADDAVYELNGKELLGERIAVEHCKGPGYRRSRFHPPSHTPRPRKQWLEKVSVEKARGTPRGSDVWRGGSGGRSRDYAPPPPRRRQESRGRDRDDHRNNDRYGPPTRTEYRLIVENLSSRVSWQDLKDYMRQAGEVTYADAHKQRRNEGVVEFASYSDMKTALDRLDDTELNGRHIRLVEDKRHRRSRSSSSRSRSHSRDRSKSSRSHSRSRSKSAGKSVSRSKSRSKSGSIRDSKSKSRSPDIPKKRSISRSTSVSNHKRAKRSDSESSGKGYSKRSASPSQNGRSAGSGDED